MKPPILLIVLIIIALKVESTSAQPPHCSSIVNTQTTYDPTNSNFWDWKNPVWPTNIYSTLSGQINSIVSPFYTIQGNLDNYSNSNITLFVQNADKDFLPEEGWELITKNLGIQGGTPIANAYVIFYNKYTSKIRAFFLITQLFSSTLNNDATQGGIVKIYFENQFNSTLRFSEPYQSNLLTTYSAPLQPLDQFKRDISMTSPNEFRNTLPYWLYADFPVAYDPCTCGNKGTLTIETSLVNSGKVDIKIASLPYQSPIDNDKVNKTTDFRQSFTDFAGQVEGGLKSAASGGEALTKINDVIAKQTKLDIKNKLLNQFGSLSNEVNSLGNWISIIPFAGSAISALTSMFDAFSGGGSSTKGPSPVMIMNDFKASGTISSTSGTNKATFPLPGSDQTGKALSGRPQYNNTLGVFNLLYTPTVKIKEGKYLIDYSPTGQALMSQQLYFQLDDNPNNLKFSVNPALNIDLANSDIRAAWIIEGCPYGGTGSSSNLQVDIESMTSRFINPIPVYRSSYYPLNTLKNGVPHISIFDASSALCTDPKVYIKIVARLKKQGSINPSEDIVFIAKYPTSSTKINFTSTISGGIEDYPEDLILADNYAITNSPTWIALNTLSLGSFNNPSNLNEDLYAGQSMTLRTGAVITPNVSIKVGPQYVFTSPSYPSVSVLPLLATSNDLSTLCNSSAYKDASNRNVAARVSAKPDEQEVIEIDKYFSAFPNPTTGKVSFRYYIEEPSQVRLNLISTTGSIVATPVDAYQEAGPYEVGYDANNLPAGIYIYTLETSKGKETKRLVIIK